MHCAQEKTLLISKYLTPTKSVNQPVLLILPETCRAFHIRNDEKLLSFTLSHANQMNELAA